MEEVFSIGKMAQICNVSTKTLRYYDKIGLLSPSYIDKKSGYRFYSPYQVTRVLMIKELQNIGATLEEIASCIVENGNEVKVNELSTMMNKMEQLVREQIEALKSKEMKIKAFYNKLECLNKTWGNEYCDKLQIKYIEERQMICKTFQGKLCKDMFSLTFAEIGKCLGDDTYSMFPEICSKFEGKRNVNDIKINIGFIDVGYDLKGAFNKVVISEDLYAVFTYKGDYRGLDDKYEALCHYLNTIGYEIKNYYVERYLRSDIFTRNEKDYLTELQIPIKLK